MSHSLRCCLAALAIVPFSHASGQAISYWAQCTPGALRACVSVSVWNAVDPGTGQPALYLRLSNLQGSRGFADVGISALGIWQLNGLAGNTGRPAGSNLTDLFEINSRRYAYADGNVRTCGVTDPPNCRPANDDDVAVDWWAFSDASGQVSVNGSMSSMSSSILWGCDVPVAGSYYSGTAAYSTCDGGGVTWRLDLGAGRDLIVTNQTTVELWVDTGGDGMDSFGAPTCTVGVDCVTVTPEPATLTLVGVGLAAVAAARRRRRTPKS
ncbi:MAG TPA: PEP-CTERM sorting domain-containing protein [Gemmatimonadaceae bacterium]|nr:PEP-CTERM sorting domain-containing protein [Gemmatimonadaceae bacterium]